MFVVVRVTVAVVMVVRMSGCRLMRVVVTQAFSSVTVAASPRCQALKARLTTAMSLRARPS